MKKTTFYIITSFFSDRYSLHMVPTFLCMDALFVHKIILYTFTLSSVYSSHKQRMSLKLIVVTESIMFL